MAAEGLTNESGTLYVVASPIGNLDDITIRAIRTLRKVDSIVAEDSRHTKRLLERYGVDTRFTVSYYRGADRDRREEIISKLLNGEDLALISNAGTPLISDPGFKLVRDARRNDISLVGIPGPNAAITCLSVAGQPTDNFTFLGQAPKKASQKKRLFSDIKTMEATVVLYDSPHRIEKTFSILSDELPNRNVTLCRELTKRHEETIKGTVQEIYASLKEKKIRGEFTVVISGASEEELKSYKREKHGSIPVDQQLEGVRKLYDLGRKESLKKLAEIRGQPKRELYDELHK